MCWLGIFHAQLAVTGAGFHSHIWSLKQGGWKHLSPHKGVHPALLGASEKPKDRVCRLESHPSLKSQFEPLFKGCGSRRHLLMGEAVENTWPFLSTIIYVLQKEVFFRFRFQLQAVAAVLQLWDPFQTLTSLWPAFPGPQVVARQPVVNPCPFPAALCFLPPLQVVAPWEQTHDWRAS